MAVWLGIAAGLVEGVGLFASQAINWHGRPPYVSGQIIWISSVVDAALFLLVVLLCLSIARFVRRWHALRIALFSCIFLTAYDWLTVFARLYYLSSLVLAAGISSLLVRWLWRRHNAAFRFWKRTLPWAVALFLFAVVALRGGSWEKEQRALAGLPPAAPGAPNVLVIVVDTLRADHLSCYGYARPTTPNIDRLAGQGTLFENAVSPSSWTFPSHVSLLTGRYMYQHGVGSVPAFPLLGLQDPGLGGSPTLSEVLEQHGFRTGAFSANRFFFTGNLGFSRGFTHFEDFFYSPADMFVRTLFGREMAAVYWRRGHMRTVVRLSALFGIKDHPSGYQEDWENSMANEGLAKRAQNVNDELLQWIDKGPQAHPFFAFVNYFDVHMPYGGPPHYSRPGWSQDTYIDHYDDGIKYVDDAVGKLLAQLDASRTARQTIIIFTSDHGESLGEHGFKEHGATLYWDTLHVPFIVSYPGRVPQGARQVAPVSNASIPTTVLDLLGIAGNASFSVPSVKPLWESPGHPAPANLIWSELAKEAGGRTEDDAKAPVIPTAETGAMESVVTPQWHFITHQIVGDQLYDWVHDPEELHDLVHTPEGQKVAAELRAQMQQTLAANASSKH